MAGLGWRAWTRETLSAAFLQGYIQDQVVQKYASAAARTAVKAVPDDGMVSILTDGHGIPDVGIGGVWRPTSSLIDASPISTAATSAVSTDTRVTTTAANRTLALKAGRLYQVTFSALMDADVASGGEARIRGKAGATPVAADTCLCMGAAQVTNPGRPQNVWMSGHFGVVASGNVTLSLFLRRLAAAGTITISGTAGSGIMDLDVHERGPYVAGFPQL